MSIHVIKHNTWLCTPVADVPEFSIIVEDATGKIILYNRSSEYSEWNITAEEFWANQCTLIRVLANTGSPEAPQGPLSADKGTSKGTQEKGHTGDPGGLDGESEVMREKD